jgi:IPTL-CTERM motif
MVLVTGRDDVLPVEVNVYVAGSVLLGATAVNLATVEGRFLGVMANEPIERIEPVEIDGRLRCVFLYELSFGPCDTTRPIPTLSEWVLMDMAGVLGIIGLLAIHRRK